MIINRFVKAEILMIAVFFVGIVTGVFLVNFYEDRVKGDEAQAVSGATPSDTGRQRRLNPRDRDDQGREARFKQEAQRIHDYLGLNEQQRSQIDAILEHSRGEFRKLSAETRTQYGTIGEESRKKIRAILTEEQRHKYDELMEKRDRFRQRSRSQINQK